MALIIHNHLIDRLAFFNGLVSGIALYPQVWVVLRDSSSAGVSLPTFFLIFINSFVWLAYSVHRGLISLAIASILNLFASGILIGFIVFI